MAYDKENVRCENLTPDLVVWFSSLPPLPGERQLKRSRMDWLHGLLASERFRGVFWAVVKDRKSGIVHRCNGQHTSTLLKGLGDRLPTSEDGSPQKAIIEEWWMDDVLRDGLGVFDHFDNPKSVRDNNDRTSMVKAAFVDLRNLKSNLLNQICNAIDTYRVEHDTDYHSIPARYRAEELLEEQIVREFAIFMSQFEKSENSDFISRSKGMAVAYGGFISDRKVAEKFWTSVFEDNANGDAEVGQLIEELKAMRQKGKKGERLKKAALIAWRKYVKAKQPAPKAAAA